MRENYRFSALYFYFVLSFRVESVFNLNFSGTNVIEKKKENSLDFVYFVFLSVSLGFGLSLIRPFPHSFSFFLHQKRYYRVKNDGKEKNLVKHASVKNTHCAGEKGSDSMNIESLLRLNECEKYPVHEVIMLWLWMCLCFSVCVSP